MPAKCVITVCWLCCSTLVLAQTAVPDAALAAKRKEIRELVMKLITSEKDPKIIASLRFRLAENYFGEDWKDAAVEVYRQILSEYPTYELADQVLFYLASTLADLGKQDESLDDYKLLITEYPKSRFLPDAYLAFGEYYFDRTDVSAAMKFYEKVIQFPDSPVYGFALYKLGWCHFNLSRMDAALENFAAVVRLADRQEPGFGKNPALRAEALKDAIRTLGVSEMKPKLAEKFIERLAPKESAKLLERLADQYCEHGKYQNAIETYRILIPQADASGVGAIHFQSKIIESLLVVGLRMEAVKEAGRMLDFFQASDHNRTILSVDALKKLEENKDEAERLLRKTIEAFCGETGATASQETCAMVRELEAIHVRLFPPGKLTPCPCKT